MFCPPPDPEIEGLPSSKKNHLKEDAYYAVSTCKSDCASEELKEGRFGGQLEEFKPYPGNHFQLGE